MPFTEKIKIDVKMKADFKCCRCHDNGVEVHHIVEESMSGPNTFDNAAPLCPSCHAYFGGNPDKRKEIEQMRDYWYKRVEEMYSKNKIIGTAEFEKLRDTLTDIRQETSQLSELKKMLENICGRAIAKVTPETAEVIVSGIIDTTSTVSASTVSAAKLGEWCMRT